MKLRGIVATLAIAIALGGSAHAQKRWADPYQSGVKAFESGKYVEAVAQLERAVAADPKAGANKIIEGVFRIDYFPYYYLGLAYVELGQFEKAQANLERARSTLTRQHQAKFAGAESKVKLALSPTPAPTSPPPIAFDNGVRRAESMVSAKQFEAAIKEFDQLRTLDPAAYGKTALAAKRDEAVKGLADQLTDDARAALSASKFKQAHLKLQQAEQVLPGQKPVTDLLADIKKREDDYQRLKTASQSDFTDRNYASARDKLQQAQVAQPEQFAADNLATRLAEVSKLIETVTPPAPPPNVPADPKLAEGQRFAATARQLIAAGQYAEAEAAYLSAVRADPKNQEAVGALDKAKRFRRLRDLGLQLNRSNNRAAAQKVLIEARNLDAARFDREGLTLDPVTRRTEEELMKRPLQEALLALFSGDAQRSIDILEPALSRGDRAAPLHAYLGVAYATRALTASKPDDRTRLREKAVEHFLRAKAAEPDFLLSPRVVSPTIVSIYQSAGR